MSSAVKEQGRYKVLTCSDNTHERGRASRMTALSSSDRAYWLKSNSLAWLCRSNNMAIKGVAEFYEGSGKKHIVTTQTESAWHVALGQPQGQKIALSWCCPLWFLEGRASEMFAHEVIYHEVVKPEHKKSTNSGTNACSPHAAVLKWTKGGIAAMLHPQTWSKMHSETPCSTCCQYLDWPGAWPTFLWISMDLWI